MKILLADDDPKIHTIVQLWLNRNGHEMETAQNGREALDKLKKGGFDCLITDVNMPLINGIDLTKSALELRQPPCLIVILTSRCDIQQLQQQINSSRVHLFSKPFSPAALGDLIEKLASERVVPS